MKDYEVAIRVGAKEDLIFEFAKEHAKNTGEIAKRVALLAAAQGWELQGFQAREVMPGQVPFIPDHLVAEYLKNPGPLDFVPYDLPELPAKPGRK
ncbi:hypothetical protein [uncultured Hyphomicrobium sp.]|jgi:hypothetical protein|uniref:hypothetical protein n=1 Tax=uncultured Hyphomicrobium sp. TaxID=194373 RepID=UPI0025F2EB5F|nr:hypothetical protein [uncultured Hyphomicrobium sp.]